MSKIWSNGGSFLPFLLKVYMAQIECNDCWSFPRPFRHLREDSQKCAQFQLKTYLLHTYRLRKQSKNWTVNRWIQHHSKLLITSSIRYYNEVWAGKSNRCEGNLLTWFLVFVFDLSHFKDFRFVDEWPVEGQNPLVGVKPGAHGWIELLVFTRFLSFHFTISSSTSSIFAEFSVSVLLPRGVSICQAFDTNIKTFTNA